MDCQNAKTVNQCIEIATCDAYDDDEQAAGWQACFEEVFDDVDEIEVLGEVVRLVSFDVSGTEVVAVCQKGSRRAKVTIDSMALVGATRAQKLWVKAWQAWRN